MKPVGPQTQQGANRSESGIRRWQDRFAAILGLSFLAVLATLGPMGTRYELSQITLSDVDDSPKWITLAGILGLIILNGIFVAAETAVEHLRAVHLKFLKEQNEKQAKMVQEMLENQSRYASACSLGSQCVRLLMVIACFLLAPAATKLMGWQLTYWNITLATLIVALPVGVYNLVFGELVPKSFASLHPPRISVVLSRFIQAASFLFAAPLWLITSIANLFTSRFGGRATLMMANAAEEEIKTIVDTAEVAGEFEIEEKELLHSVFEFGDTIAREVMTPRVDLDAMSVRSDPTEVMNLIQETGHSRIPLFEDTDDQIVGIIHAKDMLTAIVNKKAPNLRTLMRPVLFVPESKNLHELLKEMRLHRTQMAIVQDEFGGTAGIVTIEDIVEELVGDIIDEYDVEEPEVQEIPGGWLVDGRAHVDDVNSEIGSEFESEDYDTIGGLVFGAFGRQAKQEDTIDVDGFRFTVVETDGRRLSRLKVEEVSEHAESEGLVSTE